MMKRDEASASLDGARVRAGDAFRDGLEVKERVSWRARRGEVKKDERRSEDHASSPDIPFNKLLPSKARMRRVNAGVSIEQLAENIAQRTAGLERPNETGMFEVPAAAGVIVHRSFWSIPCVVRDGGIAEDGSLAENRERVGRPIFVAARGRHAAPVAIFVGGGLRGRAGPGRV